MVDPRHVKRNVGARAGDVLVIGKPLGVGIYSAALKKASLSEADYAARVASTTRLNTPGIALGAMEAIHALTDVTGFGLLGHLLEVCRASGVRALIDYNQVPLHPHVGELARSGFITGASARNWTGYGNEVSLRRPLDEVERAILTDPQTSGGLLVACAREAAAEVLSIFSREGFAHARVIGEPAPGAPRVEVR